MTLRVPPAPGRGRRHNSATVAKARTMYASGWTPHEIQKALERQGVNVSFATVKAWVDDEYRRRRNRVTAEDQRRWRDVAGDHVRKRMVELADAGLTPKAISVVVETYHGREIPPRTVSTFLDLEREKRRAA